MNGIPSPTAATRPARRSLGLVALVLLVFFVISFLTNIVGPLVPDIIKSFDLSLTLVALLPFAFFIAYGVASIPAGMLVERYREKPVMLGAFLLAFAGALLFAARPGYPTAIVSLFLIGTGMAALQVAVNPLLRVAGGEEHYAFNSVLAQLVFGGASTLSPFVYTYFVRNIGQAGGEGKPLVALMTRLVPPDLPWVAVYWVLAALVAAIIAVLAVVRFPAVAMTEGERAGAWAAHKALLKNPAVPLFFLGIFAYVGTEQGVVNWMSQFFAAYHGADPQTVGAAKVASFWGLMTIGGIHGLFLLKITDSRRVLVSFSGTAILALTLGLFGPRPVALFAFPLVGFSAAVMWPIIFSLALNSVERHHGSFSGILCTGVVGGALVQLVIGRLGDAFGLRWGMLVLYLTLGYILSIGLWARPLVVNKTVARRQGKEKP